MEFGKIIAHRGLRGGNTEVFADHTVTVGFSFRTVEYI